jgi:hypothetical protein
MMFRVLLGVATLTGIQMAATASQAGQTGLAAMHDQRIVAGRLCFTDHTHVGTGLRAASKREAISLAARDWSAFTAFEYGADWAQWRVARNKKEKCQKSGGGYVCEVQAMPCLAKSVRSATR